jgi:translation initiation factor SUI1
MNSNIIIHFEDNQTELFNSKVTISVDRRNGKKCRTNVIGMADDLDLHKILSYLKKKLNCNGSVIKDEIHGEIMSFTGDQKEHIFNFLIKEEIYQKEDIIIKGV